MTEPIKISARGYLHFDEPFHGQKAVRFVTNRRLVSSWSFMSFIHTVIGVRKAKRVNGKPVPKWKTRDIYYAAHHDAAIYSYYAQMLNEAYNILAAELGINEVVTAFRSNLHKCNVHFAVEAFAYIKLLGDCVVLTYDVTSFFDNLDHKLLKSAWAKSLKVVELPPDHYAVYKSISKFAYVDCKMLMLHLGLVLITQRLIVGAEYVIWQISRSTSRGQG